MIANFQSHNVALWYRNWLWGQGYIFSTMIPYRGGFQVFTTGVRLK